MYGALWRALPGPRWWKVIECLALAAGVVAALFAWVFPWVAEQTDLADSATMSAPAAPAAPAALAGSPGGSGAVHNGV